MSVLFGPTFNFDYFNARMIIPFVHSFLLFYYSISVISFRSGSATGAPHGKGKYTYLIGPCFQMVNAKSLLYSFFFSTCSWLMLSVFLLYDILDNHEFCVVEITL